MCKPNTPDTSAQQAEAARQAAVQQQQYQQQLAAQQTEWDRQRQDSEARYQSDLAAQNAEIARQGQLQKDAADQAEQLRQQQIAQQQAVNQRGTSYADYRDQLVKQAQDKVNQQFAGFDSSYFQNFANNFLTANSGDTNRQYDQSTRAMRYKLADNRNLNSSAAADAFGELDTDRNSAISKIAAAASDKANTYAQQIGQQKQNALSSIYGLANTTTPDFQTDEDLNSAKSRIAQTVAGFSVNPTPAPALAA
jgi:hypothetical protein